MKLIRIIILIALVVSFMPFDAFCEDHHDDGEHHHGVVMCHASCHGAILISEQSVDFPDPGTSFYLSQQFYYEEPTLPTEYRPPITLS